MNQCLIGEKKGPLKYGIKPEMKEINLAETKCDPNPALLSFQVDNSP